MPQEGFWVAISDVHLDNNNVVDRLRAMFITYTQSGAPPIGFILMGDFISKKFTHSAEMVNRYRENFENFADLLEEFPVVSSSCRFILIPGPNDPGADILPKRNLPAFLTNNIEERFPNVTLASNPCRIRYFDKEVVICRQNLLANLRKSAVFSYSEQDDDQEESNKGRLRSCMEMVRTIMEQAHLCPLPSGMRPVYWDYDYTLRLHQSPDVVIFGDECDGFDTNFDGTLFCNTGSFTRTEYSFYVYHPHASHVEVSQIDDRQVKDILRSETANNNMKPSKPSLLQEEDTESYISDDIKESKKSRRLSSKLQYMRGDDDDGDHWDEVQLDEL
eukprot:GHVL01006276.1.p1 GENE.GHVL01006276.1~~GHVL01006276.1.p1  ORF type:complete len:332 (+),score=85.69 GHVL01006276.1:344-1339(+)